MKKYLFIIPITVILFYLPALALAENNFLPFSNLFAFGDSLTDTGNISGSPYTDKNPDGSAALWINNLGNDLGLGVLPSRQGGNNYAEAGAVTSNNLPFDTGSTPTMTAELSSYFSQTNHHADPDALYAVWGGGNDLRNGAPGIIAHTINPLDLISISTRNIADMVQQLHQAGANYILVPNIPDFSQSPYFKQNYSSYTAQLSQLVQNYNQQLLSTLNATGEDIIQIDIFGMFNAIQNNYAAFGFKGADTVTCDPLSEISCTHNNQDIFYSDGFHPSQASHLIGADYILSVLQGPEFARFLAEVPLSVMTTQNTQIQSELSAIKMPDLLGHWRVFTAGDYHQSKQDPHNLLEQGYHQNNTAFTIGAEYGLNAQTVIGAAVGRSMGRVTDENNTTGFKFDLDENMADIFSLTRFWHNKAYINSVLGFGNIDESNIQRNFMLGIFPETVSGETTGEHYDAAVQTGYRFEYIDSKLTTGPVASLEYQFVHINPYAETSSHFEVANSAFDALQYDPQDNESLLAGIGWKLDYQADINHIKILPFIQAGYAYQILNHPNSVSAGVTSLPGSHFSLPADNSYHDYALFSGGLHSVISKQLLFTADYNLIKSQDYTSQGMMISFSWLI